MEEEFVKTTSLWKDAWKRLWKNKLAVVGLYFLVFITVTVIVGPFLLQWFTNITPDGMPSNGDLYKSAPPSWKNWMGTDDAGRDIFSRVLQGGRISLMVGLISTIVSLLLGVSWGAIAGYLGGGIDNVLMRIVDLIYSIPYILLVVVLLSVFGGPNTRALIELIPVIVTILITLFLIALVGGIIYKFALQGLVESLPGFGVFVFKSLFILICLFACFVGIYLSIMLHTSVLTNVGKWLADQYIANVNQGLSQIFLLFIALGLISWLTMARIVRGQILSLKNQEFVLAAKATGVSMFGIIFRHLVPNTLGPVIVYATLTIPTVMLSEAFLSFLGLGVQAPYASWGSLDSEGIKNISIFPWQLLFPGITMALTLFSLNFLGDGLRDALDPQTRKF